MRLNVSSGRFQYRRPVKFRFDFTYRNWLRRQQREPGDFRLDRLNSRFEMISFDHRMGAESLYRVCLGMQSTRDPAPGRDGVRLRSLGRSEVGEITRGLADRVRYGRYIPQLPRLVRIPKPGRDEFRQICLPGAADHIIATAINSPLSVALDRLLLQTCYGLPNASSARTWLAVALRPLVRRWPLLRPFEE